MKKLFMMITAAFIAVSCDNNDIEDTAAKITVGQKTVSAAADGGIYEIDYEIEGYNGGDICIDRQDDWVKVDEVGESTIFLDIAPNTDEDARTATLDISYKNADPVYIIIIQKGKTPETVNEEMFTIDVTDITTGTATVSIEPVGGHNKTYLYSVVDKQSYEIYGTQAYIEACINRIDEYIIAYKEIYGQIVTFSDFLSRNATVNTASSLNDDTEYYAVAFDLDVNKKYSGSITLKSFKTQQAQQSSNRFNLKMYGSILNVTTTNNDPYIYDVLTKESWSEFKMPREAAQMFVSTMRSYGLLSMYIANGSRSEDFASTLDHSGNYVAYAFGYNDDSTTGGITTEIEYIEFSYTAATATATAASAATITGQGRISLAGNEPALRPIIMTK